jgi:hypothetical protein
LQTDHRLRGHGAGTGPAANLCGTIGYQAPML